MNQDFQGFLSEMQKGIHLPDEFFFEVLPRLKDETELRLALFSFWALEQQDENEQYLFLDDFFDLPAWLWPVDKNVPKNDDILAGLQSIMDIGILLGDCDRLEDCTFLVRNSTQGKALLAAFKAETWKPGSGRVNYHQERKNVFQLYEENIGPLTPLIADSITQAEKEYGSVWVAEAIQTAVKSNARRWRYIERVLQNRKEEGRYAKPKRDYTESYQRYFDNE